MTKQFRRVPDAAADGVGQDANAGQTEPRPGEHADRQRDPRWLVPALALFAVGTTTRFGIRPVSDPDAWWHLKAGAYLLSHWRFDGPDPWVPFSSRPFAHPVAAGGGCREGL